MALTHGIGSGGSLAQASPGPTLGTMLSDLTRLLNTDWRNAGWMLDNAPKSLQETLNDARFIAWLSKMAGGSAVAAASNFGSLQRASQQVLAMLVRCYRLDHTPPGWARNFVYAGA